MKSWATHSFIILLRTNEKPVKNVTDPLECMTGALLRISLCCYCSLYKFKQFITCILFYTSD
jgi:hypothetical protein